MLTDTKKKRESPQKTGEKREGVHLVAGNEQESTI